MTKDEALPLALEALENGKRVRNAEGGTKYQPDLEDKAITAIKAALEAQDKPMHPEIKKLYEDFFDKCFRESSPLQRTWVGLTNEETVAIELGLRIPTGYRDAYDLSLHDFAKTIEAKLKEKNT